MKRIKKLASLLLAMVMALAMTMTAFAADNHPHTITVTQNAADKTEHTYEAYQIFKGDLATVGGEEVLSNIEWGTGIAEPDALLAALKSEAAFNGAFGSCTTAAAVAEVLADPDKFVDSTVTTTTLTDTFATVLNAYLSTTVAGTGTGAGNVTIDVTGSGYYLVKDQNESVDTENGAYTRILLEVVGDAQVNVKSEVPSGEKKVYVVGPDGNTFDPGDANYGNIGSHVSYEIKSSVPNHVGYDYYYFVMNDTLSKGLTFDGAESVKVTVGGTALTQGTDYFVYTENVGTNTFRLAFNDIQNYTVGAEIVLTYSATINDQAVIGNSGNPNTWNLQYSNNPNQTYDGTQDQSRPGLPADETTTVLGQTPDDITLTYLTELDITKYANEVLEANLLPGAEFTLTGTSYQVVLENVVYYEAAENGTYYQLKDGTYTTDAPTGTDYVEIGVGTADTEKGYLKNADGDYYIPSDKAEYEGKAIYKLVQGTAEAYLDVNTKYVQQTKTETTLVPVEVSMEMTTGADGKISFAGLGAGSYTLTETVTPAGFNTIEPINFTIKVKTPTEVKDGTETCEWTIDWNGATNNGGIFSADVVNQSGSLLPSTGGIGTTIFYVVGGILVVAAGILLVTKKRMSAR